MIRQEAIDFDKAVVEEFEGLVLRPKGMVEWRKTDVLLTAFFLYEDRYCREDISMSKEMWGKMGPESAAALLRRVTEGTIANFTLRDADVAPRL